MHSISVITFMYGRLVDLNTVPKYLILTPNALKTFYMLYEL
jgi:hypothetical protein